MTTPATLKAIGAPRPNTATGASAAVPAGTIGSTHARFADLRAWRRGLMPEVHPGQVWADQDPRCAGRTVQVLTVHSDDRVTVRTLTARSTPARTPAASTKDTVGATTRVKLRRFRPGTRGFALLDPGPAATWLAEAGLRHDPQPAAPSAPSATPHALSSATSASRPRTQSTSEASARDHIATQDRHTATLAAILSAGRARTTVDERAAAALLGLLGATSAIQFLTSRPSTQSDSPLHTYASAGLPALLAAAGTWALSRPDASGADIAAR